MKLYLPSGRVLNTRETGILIVALVVAGIFIGVPVISMQAYPTHTIVKILFDAWWKRLLSWLIGFFLGWLIGRQVDFHQEQQEQNE